MPISNFRNTIVDATQIEDGIIGPDKLDLTQVYAFTALPSVNSNPASANDLCRKSYVDASGGGGGSTDPAGSNTQIQFNNSGSFGASADLVFANSQLTVPSVSVSEVHFDDITGIANDTGSGEVIKFGTGSLTAGKLYYLDTDSAWKETDADSLTAGSTQLLGIALGSSPTTNGLLKKGYFDVHTFLDGSFSAGAPVYMSTTNGGISTVKPNDSGKVARLVGYCSTTAKVIYFDPEHDHDDNISIPYPTEYWDCSTVFSQIGGNKFAVAALNTSEGKFDSACLEFGNTGTHRPATLAQTTTLFGCYTWMFYFKSKRTGDLWGSLLRRGGTGSSSAHYAIISHETSDELGMYTGGVFYGSGYDLTALEGSTDWNHLTVSANGTKSRFFINGAFVGEASGVIDGEAMGEIGSYDGDDNQVFSEFLDEVAFWNATLTDDQVKKIYDAQKQISKIVY